jgi:uncharacterized OB-fold protein
MSDQVAQQTKDAPMTLKQQEDALRDGRIVGFECAECGLRRLTPMVRCPNGHVDVRSKQFATTGIVDTYTIQHISSEAFMNEVPFAWAIIRLDDGGPRVSGWIPFVSKPEDLPVGSKVTYSPSYKPGMRFEKSA